MRHLSLLARMYYTSFVMYFRGRLVKKNHVSNPKRQAEVGNRVIFHFASEAMNQTRPEYVFMRVFVWFSFRGQKSFYVYRSLWDFSFAKTGEAGVVQKNNFFSIISNVRSSVLIHSNYGQVFFLGKTLTCRRNLALYVFLWFLLRTLFGRTWPLFSVGYFFFCRFSQFSEASERSRIYFSSVSLSLHLVTIHSEYEMRSRIWRGFAYEFMKNDFLTRTFVSK